MEPQNVSEQQDVTVVAQNPTAVNEKKLLPRALRQLKV